jgi:CDP-glycerol glycerophosphotransferase (TagB/SpsB family)
MFYSARGMYFSFIAKVIFVSRTWNDMPLTAFLFPRNKLYVQLWHGTPLKKLEFLLKGTLVAALLKKILQQYMKRKYDFVISSTEANRNIYHNVFSIDLKNIAVLGQPRNDILMNKSKGISFGKKRKKKILYMPTWRSYSFDYFSTELGFSFKRMNSYLEKNNSQLFIKLHFHEQKKRLKVPQYENIIFMKNIDDIYPYLHKVDVLITDYSSIFFDYLLLDKPMIFFSPDEEKYVKSVGGFYYDYESLIPGINVKNWNEVLTELDLLLQDTDRFQVKRKKTNVRFNEFRDSRSSERVYAFIYDKVFLEK